MKFTLMGCLKAGAVAIGMSYLIWGSGHPGYSEQYMTRGKEYEDALKRGIKASEDPKQAVRPRGRMGD